MRLGLILWSTVIATTWLLAHSLDQPTWLTLSLLALSLLALWPGMVDRSRWEAWIDNAPVALGAAALVLAVFALSMRIPPWLGLWISICGAALLGWGVGAGVERGRAARRRTALRELGGMSLVLADADAAGGFREPIVGRP